MNPLKLLQPNLWISVSSLLMNIACVLKKNTYSSVVGIFCECQFYSYSIFVHPYWFSVHLFYQLLRKKFWIIQLHCGFIYFTLNCQFFLHLNSIFRCILIQDCYDSLMNWYFHHCDFFIFILGNFFILNLIFLILKQSFQTIDWIFVSLKFVCWNVISRVRYLELEPLGGD